MEKNFYTANSPNYVAAYEGKTELGNGLHYWPEACCEVYRVETLEEANVVARQTYLKRFYGNPAMFGVQPMALPSMGTFAVQAPPESRLMAPQESNEAYLPASARMALPPASRNPMTAFNGGGAVLQEAPLSQEGAVLQGGPLSRGGAWSLVWLRGYAVLEGIGCLIETISKAECVYPHATWWWNPGHAVLWAQREYAERFSRCFDVRDFRPAMPDRPVQVGEAYTNPNEDYLPSNAHVFEKLRKMGIL